ncbi:hypothetical protein [Pseudonocardia halophobica]|nr:hypothetical protein [Pseudonocardia halophobica]
MSGSTTVVEPDAERPETAADAPASGDRRRGPARAVTVLALVALVAAAVAGVYAGIAQRSAADGRAAVDAARQVATNLTTIKQDTADADLQRLLDGTTGDFKAEFEQRRGPFVQIVQQAKVSTEGQVVEAGLDSLDGDTARTLVAVHSTVTNSAATQPENRDYRLAVTLDRVDGRWLASSVEFVA